MTALTIDGPIIANWVTGVPDANGVIVHEVTSGSAILVDGASLSGIQLMTDGSPLEPGLNQFGALWVWSTSTTTLVHEDTNVSENYRLSCTQGVNFELGPNPLALYWEYREATGTWRWRTGDWNLHELDQGMFLSSLVSGRSANIVYRGPAATITRVDYVLSGSLTIATSATLTLRVNGVAATDGAVTITAAASGEGTTFSVVPTAGNTIAPGDVVTVSVTGTNLLDTTTAGVTLSLFS